MARSCVSCEFRYVVVKLSHDVKEFSLSSLFQNLHTWLFFTGVTADVIKRTGAQPST